MGLPVLPAAPGRWRMRLSSAHPGFQLRLETSLGLGRGSISSPGLLCSPAVTLVCRWKASLRTPERRKQTAFSRSGQKAFIYTWLAIFLIKSTGLCYLQSGTPSLCLTPCPLSLLAFCSFLQGDKSSPGLGSSSEPIP